MQFFLRIFIVGNLTRDPELRYTLDGSAHVEFRVAVPYRRGGRQLGTDLFTVIAWKELAQQCNRYLRRGRRVFVEGRPHARTWLDKKGNEKFVNEIHASLVLFLDPRPEEDEPLDLLSLMPPGLRVLS